MLAMVRMLRNFLFIMILMVGCSLAGFGQNNDNHNDPPPKKENPPTVKVGDKNTEKPKDPPKNDSNKPKKPNNEMSVRLQGIGAV